VQEIRPLLHDILNALAIAQGHCENVHSSLGHEGEMTSDQMREKLTRALKAMEKIDSLTNQIRDKVSPDL
jgi:thioredoxin-like negative regulator of GroEL